MTYELIVENSNFYGNIGYFSGAIYSLNTYFTNQNNDFQDNYNIL